MNNLPKVDTAKRNGRDSNPRPFESQVHSFNHYATRPQTNCNQTVNLSLTCNVTPIVTLTRGRQVSIPPGGIFMGRGFGADVPAR